MKEVIIYSTPSCIHCQHAKEFLEENKIEFTENNVAENPEKREEMVEKSGQMGVPVIMIGDEVIIGYDEPKMKELLELE